MTYKTKSLIVAALLSWSVAGMAADPIKIGVSGPFTGGSAPMGVSMRDGVKLAVTEINAKGGVLGRPLQLVERDDEAKNERGVQVAQELINKEKVVATVGFINTGVALAAQKHYQEAKIPVVTNVSAGATLTKQFLPPKHPDNYIFRNSAGDGIQSEMVVREAVKKKGFKKIAIFADVTAYGKQGKELLEQALGKFDLKPVAVESFKIGDTDMTAQLRRARKAGAEVLLC